MAVAWNVRSEVLERWNPWWADGTVPDKFMGRPRDLLGDLESMMGSDDIVTLVGVRRSGKSTLLYQLVDRLLGSGVPTDNVLLVNLEDPRLEGATVGDLLSAYRQLKAPAGPTYVLLDEVQASVGWERWVLSEYERKVPIKFVVTGSSSSVVRSELAHLLTGRTLTLTVHPLSFGEFLRFRGVDLASTVGEERRDLALHHLGAYLDSGGFPKVAVEGESYTARRLSHYFDAILYKDVVFRHGVDPARLQSLAAYILANIGTEQTLRSLAAAVEMDPGTVKDYVAHLVEAHLLVTVEALTFKTKPAARSRMPRRYFCVDTGLRNAVAPRHSPDRGRLLENAVCMELVRRGERPRYWRNRGEVDFVTGTRPGRLHPINVCFTDDVPAREYEGLSSFGGHVPPPLGEPLLLTRSIEGRAKGVMHVPAWRWLLDPTEGP
jgi:predicted AAA+ superfamily ATPase